MKKVKISFAALALMLTLGASVSAHVKTTLINDCSSVLGGSSFDRDSQRCSAGTQFCCSNPSNTYLGPYNP